MEKLKENKELTLIIVGIIIGWAIFNTELFKSTIGFIIALAFGLSGPIYLMRLGRVKINLGLSYSGFIGMLGFLISAMTAGAGSTLWSLVPLSIAIVLIVKIGMKTEKPVSA